MYAKSSSLSEDLRMIWAIAAKDIVDGLRSRTIWKYMFIVVLVMVSFRFMPMLGQMGEVEVVVFDEGESGIVAALEASGRFEVRNTTSMQEFEDYMNDADEGELGLVIPAGFDLSQDSGDPVVLEGHVLWSSRLRAEALQEEYAIALSSVLGTPVQVVPGSVILPGPDSMGMARMVALIPFLTVIIVGMMTTPQLMFDEKANRTLDTLLISPANTAHVVAGKAIAGAVYCLVTGAIWLAFNWTFVVNWDLVILAYLGTTVFGVGLGLALGSFLESQQQLGFWSMILFQPILIPVIFYAIEPIFPLAVRQALPWIPTVTLVKLFHQSFTVRGASGMHAGHLLTLVGSILLLFTAVIFILRRSKD